MGADPHDPFGDKSPKPTRKPEVFDPDYEGEGPDPFKSPEPVWEPETEPKSTQDV